MNISKTSFFKSRKRSIKKSLSILATAAAVALTSPVSNAQTLTQNATGTHDDFYYSFWKDSGNVSFGLESGGRYTSQWSNVNNWVGGKGWNPGGRRVISYSGSYNVDNSQNSYLALYGWTTDPLIEYYVIESYGSYNPSNCSGGQNYGSFQSDGATYNIRRCQRVNQPSIQGTATFYQYFSVRTPKKGFGNISGTITVGNHFDAWAAAGLNLGNHDYQIIATEGYQSTGSSDITVCEGTSCVGGGSSSGGGGGSSSSSSGGSGSVNTNPSSTDIVVRARGTAGGEHINLLIGGSVVADWNLTTSDSSYTYTGNAGGDLQVEFDNDGGDRDVILDYVYVNGETRQAEDMDYNTATYANGECGGGSNSETMHCGGVIGFGGTGDCFSGNCNGGNPGSGSSSSGSSGGGSSSSSSSGGSTGNSGDIVVRARGTNGDEQINLNVGGNTVATWTLSTGNQNYNYNGNAVGDVDVEFTNDASGRDVILDYVIVNGETRQAEDMDYNTATYGNGECGGGSYSETMHCSGVIGFGHTDDCFNGNCSGGSSSGGSNGGSTSSSSSGGGSTGTGSCQCNWWGTMYPICASDNGWGWENNQSCIGTSTCNSQSGNGGVVCN